MAPVLAPTVTVLRSAEAQQLAVPRTQLHSPSYTRVRRGTYVSNPHDPADPDVRLAIAAAAASPRATLGGWAAARLHEREALGAAAEEVGLVLFDGTLPWPPGESRTEPILVCLPRHGRLRPAPDVRIFRSDLSEDDVCEVGGVRVTTPARTAFDLARLRDRTNAVIALDRLAHLGLVDLEDLAELFRGRPRWRGAGQGLAAVLAADPGAESPQETVVRLLCRAGGVTGLVANPTLRDVDGRFIARVDLLDPACGLVIEYDGAHHATASRRRRDAERQERLESAGLVVVRVTAVDLVTEDHRRALVTRVRQARARARTWSRGPRRWRIEA